MRSLVVLTTLLFLLPVAAAQGQGSGGSQGGPDGSGAPEGAGDRDGDGLPDSWERRYFGNMTYNGSDDPDHDGDNNTVEHEMGTDPTRPPEAPPSRQDPPGRACRDAEDRDACITDYCEEQGDHASCRSVERAERIEAGARHVSFGMDASGRTLFNYSIDGVLLLERIAYGDPNSTIDVQQHDGRIRFVTGDTRLEVHDTPTGEFWFRSQNHTLLMVFPPNATVSTAVHGFSIAYPDRSARIVGDDLALTPDGIVAEGHMSFYSPVGRAGPEDEEARGAVEQAKERRQIGAEVRVAKAAPGSAGGGLPDPASPVARTRAQVTAFDEVEVNVTELPEKIQGRDKMRVLVSAELDTGRTIVVDVDPTVVGGSELIIQYYDVQANGEATEVVIHRAGSLADVLEANDDGGQPEYWVIKDDTGIHVMVSVPHWSAHIIEISALLQPSVLIGVFAGVAGAAVATVAMFWPRRREAW